MIYSVNSDGSGDFSSISEALKAMLEGDELHIGPGVYRENPVFDVSGVRIIGSKKADTVITSSLYAEMIMKDGSKRGTFRSHTALIDADNVTFENITFRNDSGPGKTVGQALAAYSEGHRIHYRKCRFCAHQDTLFIGPLPNDSIHHNGFVGPKEFSPRINGLQWFEECFVEGDVDFIFGSGTAVFTDCEICSLHRENEPEGYVTAPSTFKGQRYGFVFWKCNFTNLGCGPQSVYLSRPWREWASQIMIDCQTGEHIKSEGYHDWNKPEAHVNSRYYEFPFKEPRAEWIHEPGDEQIEEVRNIVERIMNNWESDSFADII